MEPREPNLESQFKNIRRELDVIAQDVSEINKESRRNFRILLGALVVIALGIVGLLAYGITQL